MTDLLMSDLVARAQKARADAAAKQKAADARYAELRAAEERVRAGLSAVFAQLNEVVAVFNRQTGEEMLIASPLKHDPSEAARFVLKFGPLSKLIWEVTVLSRGTVSVTVMDGVAKTKLPDRAENILAEGAMNTLVLEYLDTALPKG